MKARVSIGANSNFHHVIRCGCDLARRVTASVLPEGPAELGKTRIVYAVSVLCVHIYICRCSRFPAGAALFAAGGAQVHRTRCQVRLVDFLQALLFCF